MSTENFTSDGLEVRWWEKSIDVTCQIDEDEEETLELDLTFTANSYGPQYCVRLADGGFLVGYLSHDQLCENPLESCDGMGKLMSCQHDRGSGKEEAYDALFMTREGEPDLDSSLGQDVDDCYFRRAALALWPTAPAFKYAQDFEQFCVDHDDAIRTEGINRWVRDRQKGTVGDRYAVVLDYSNHGCSCAWRVAYAKDQFNAERIDGVWVPDDYLRKQHIPQEVEERLAKHDLVRLLRTEREGRRGHAVLTHHLSDGQTLHETEPVGTVSTLVNHHLWEQHYAARRELELAVCRDLAEQACRLYTDWANGNCWFYVVERFNAEGENLDEHDTCGGYVGNPDESGVADELRHAFLYEQKRQDEKFVPTSATSEPTRHELAS